VKVNYGIASAADKVVMLGGDNFDRAWLLDVLIREKRRP